jgi:5-methylcytosine-specific restriction endonuclease McrA
MSDIVGRFLYQSRYHSARAVRARCRCGNQLARPRALKCDACLETSELRNRARRRAGVVSERLRAEVIARDGYVCQHCGRVVRDRDRRYQTIAPDNIEIDHVVPLAEGATTTIENLVVSCMGCNKKKGGRSLTPLEETA